MFFLAYKRGYRGYVQDLLAKVKQHNISNRASSSRSESVLEQNWVSPNRTSGDELTLYPSSSASILSDMEERQIRNVTGRPAILANCCRYSKHIDAAFLRRAGYGLRSFILALSLLNGEILSNDEDIVATHESHGRTDVLAHNVQKYLHKFSLKFDPPGTAFRLSFVEHCRFVSVELTPHGVVTAGWLWKLRGAIAPSAQDRRKIGHAAERAIRVAGVQSGLDSAQKYALWMLVRKLNERGHIEFANFLADYARKGYLVGMKQAEPFFSKMLEAIAQAILDERPLRLAYLVGEEQPSGLFIDPPREMQLRKPVMAFTSWPKADEQGAEEYRQKFVSIAVRDDGTSVYGCKRLYTRARMNGIWNSRGRPLNRYLFPWPFKVDGLEEEDFQ